MSKFCYLQTLIRGPGLRKGVQEKKTVLDPITYYYTSIGSKQKTKSRLTFQINCFILYLVLLNTKASVGIEQRAKAN